MKKILILGAGLAGLSAALECANKGAQVWLASPQASERAQSVMAEGGINAALDMDRQGDSPELHARETLEAACGLADAQAVQRMTAAAPGLVRELWAQGTPFHLQDGQIALRAFGGQRKRRTAFCGTDTGKQLMTTLIDRVRQQEAGGRVRRLNHHRFYSLRLDGNRCGGAVLLDDYTGKPLTIEADAVILALGGPHGLFGDSTGSLTNTGEAQAELFLEGVTMANLECIQYHPTTARRGGRRILISEAARGEGGRLFAEENGERHFFMEEKYPELGNLMPRDITAREIWRQRQKGPVYLDLTALGASVLEGRLASLAEDCRRYLQLDPAVSPIPVEPGIHYFMGGIRVDSRHRTDLENLYAAGECCAQYHGANRLGGNSLLGAIYGGRVAAETALEEGNGAVNAVGLTPCGSGLRTAERQCLLRAMGVQRREDTLMEALQQLRPGNPATALAQAFIESALLRRESRGAHYREDAPEPDPSMARATLARWADGTVHVVWEGDERP